MICMTGKLNTSHSSIKTHTKHAKTTQDSNKLNKDIEMKILVFYKIYFWDSTRTLKLQLKISRSPKNHGNLNEVSDMLIKDGS